MDSNHTIDNDAISINSNYTKTPEEIIADNYYALEILYNSTNGTLNWFNNSNWLETDDYCTWFGIYCKNVTQEVIALYLWENGLQGTIPTEIGMLTAVEELIFWVRLV